MSFVFQVLSPGDIDEILDFANRQLEARIPDETERRFASWTVKWRKEALEHYLKLGWSFIARTLEADGTKKTAGFFLAQPFLFVRGQTQTLWVEHLEYTDMACATQLADVAVRVAREKHLQRVLFGEIEDEILKSLAPFRPALMEDRVIEVRTTKG